MNIEEKLNKFCSMDSFEYINLPAENAGLYGIRLHKSCIGTIFCEQNSVCASIRISKGGDTFIGSYSYINNGGYLKDWVFIGRYCSIGRRVSIGAGLHATDGLSTSPEVKGTVCDAYTSLEVEQLFGKFQQARGMFTLIENDVWIGDGVVILPGVRLGTGSVAAANSVITRNVTPYEVVGGVPAATLRYRFSENVINRLLASCWWNYPIEYIKGLPTGNVLRFLEQFDYNTISSDDKKTYKPIK
jgi:virginiamycin A acetyltransferase